MTQTHDSARKPDSARTRDTGRPRAAAPPRSRPSRASLDLADRYRPSSGPVLLSGVQAMVRALTEQHARDARAGVRTATFVSGYQGSPLAGVDRLIESLPDVTGPNDIRLVPGLNEELAATAVWGSQLDVPGTATHDGVVGAWYGKGPGLDRSGDAMRHGAMYGANPHGGVLVYVGDDPASKSSTVPAASERSLAALDMPVFFPRNATEMIEFSLYGVALSRASGCWSAIKVVADVADGLSTLTRDFADLAITVPEIEWEGTPWRYRQRRLAAPPDSVLAEADLTGPRWKMVEAFAAANPIDTLEVDPPHAWLGIVAPGTAYDAVRQALADFGLDEDALRAAGIRILRVGMPFPLCGSRLRELAHGVETVLVVEEKASFVESQLKDILFAEPGRPVVVGKNDADGRPLVPRSGELTAERLAGPLRRILSPRVALAPAAPPRLELTVLPSPRTAHFCSGCPHNRSTVVPDGSIAAGGIGCHTMVTMADRPESAVVGLTQMGGEGAQWIGQSPFTDTGHIFQNLGDGTYFHSGQLAVQACVAAGVNVTYKILYNSAVAMTGAQDPEGALTVPELTHKLAADGVRRIIVCADEPERHRDADLADGVVVWHRDRLDEAQRLLRDVDGVTALVYDQHCAAEARRKRKRGTMPRKRTRVVINEAVCEGCGDCGAKSNCLSVQPVSTEFGRKTRIDQSTCNTDYSCLDGDCPSFVTVTEPETPPQHAHPQPPPVPDPATPDVRGTYNLFLAGVGGTGIVTVNQILGIAALRAGFDVTGLDQTGLSQKAGPVTSHLELAAPRPGGGTGTNRVGTRAADGILAFDALTAADSRFVDVGDASRTVTVASTSVTPTGSMVRDPAVTHPEVSELLARLDARARRVVHLDSLAAAQHLFGDTAPANMLVVGAAYQAGVLPIPADRIEEAIELNGVRVAANLAAFRWGRVSVARADEFARATTPPEAPARTMPSLPDTLWSRVHAPGDLVPLVQRRAADLVRHSGSRVASHYLDVVAITWNREQAADGSGALTGAVARGLHKLTAYKDEYEVAALLTDPAFLASLDTEVPGATAPTFMLHPPTLRTLGRSRKIGFGPRSHTVLRALAKGKALRGTRLDPFAHTGIRKLERALIAHYEAMIDDLTRDLTSVNYDRVVAAADAADIVRGYEDVKLRSVERYRARLAELGIATESLDV
ncbi:indolepyruvate ferredoxin oxidoreductase family protein [Rhodococcus sp. HNM0569]|uniref:indolepyruvate ferredoxin oxidoreductase family protein n=1 Tax=Rhodococcus sp. HNM0569 TaxID=2716340 RepID=UPI00146B7C9C|nr:indolepyruvate ferredoxin oxidoreductase family protein [Rhodococcus sp. HNM0569]NLU83382.1 indolepyruvate ferredoxin oxidoreductase family protein [Rhodococcus sp. HNM0569]